jgi:dTDP-4-amino-4,6-dideoxygalactose transaminase
MSEESRDLFESSFVLPADPRAGYLAHKEEIQVAIREALESGSYILGPQVAAFEQKFAEYLGVESVIGVASGTDALLLALKALEIGSGDAVFTVSHTAVATVAAIELAGAQPVFVDVDSESFTMSPESLEKAIGEVLKGRGGSHLHPRAIVPVHIYGLPADMPAIMELAERHNLLVVEDCAQAHGAEMEGRKMGTWGHAAAFSFYPTKNLGALGDGGAIATKTRGVAARVGLLRQYGWNAQRVSEIPGYNSRLDEVQAAILRAKLKYLDADNLSRRTIARVYDEALAGTGVDLPVSVTGAMHVYHQYVIKTLQRDDLQAYLKSRGIGTAIHYPVPVHLQPAYAGRFVRDGVDLPSTEAVCRQILSLPMYPELPAEYTRRVCNAITAWK